MGVRFSNIACGLALLVAVLISSSAAFAATPYPPPPSCGTLAVTTTVPRGGDDVTLNGTGFVPGAAVTILLTHNSVQTIVAHVIASSTGTFSADVHLPAKASGTYVLSTSGGAPVGCVLEPLALTVGSGTSPAGHPAQTGVAVLALLTIAGLMLASGALFAVTGRRRGVYVGAHR